MDLDKLCIGCFNERGSGAICQRCGYDENFVPEAEVYLAPRTVLENKYLIGRILGQGGFGITYLAWDLNLNIKLAIKEYFPRELATRSSGHSQVNAYSGNLGSQYHYGLDKFLQEARTLAQFEGHPNIVSVRDYFQANNTAYLVMKYVEGITLKEHLAKSGGRLPIEQALKITMPIMDALIEVHSVNILHRDISPDNIFINEKGQVILIDFGAARQAISDKGHSMSIILKPGYAPEEQYRSKGNQGPWTDIYALAATLYHLITGRQPPESLDRLTEDQLIPPSKLGVNVKTEEENALLKALAVRAKDRYQRMEEFQKALMGQLLNESKSYVSIDHSPVKQSTSQVNEPLKEKRKLPVGLIIGITVLFLFIIVLTIFLIGDPKESQIISEPEAKITVVEEIVQDSNNQTDAQEIENNTSKNEAPFESELREPTYYIASIDATITAFDFYEADLDDFDVEKQSFAIRFPQDQTRHIYWLMDLAHPAPGELKTFMTTTYYYSSEGTLFESFSHTHTIESDWHDSWQTVYFGWQEPGNWPVDTYRVEVEVDGIVVAEGTFEIY